MEAEDLCEDDSAAAIPAASPAPATPAATNGVAPAPVDAIADPFPEGFARALLLRPLQRFLNSLTVTCSFAVVPGPVQIPQPPTPRRWEQIVDNCVRLGSLLILLLRL